VEKWPADCSEGGVLPEPLSKDQDRCPGMLFGRKLFWAICILKFSLLIQYTARLSAGDIFGSSAPFFFFIFVGPSV